MPVTTLTWTGDGNIPDSLYLTAHVQGQIFQGVLPLIIAFTTHLTVRHTARCIECTLVAFAANHPRLAVALASGPVALQAHGTGRVAVTSWKDAQI